MEKMPSLGFWTESITAFQKEAMMDSLLLSDPQEGHSEGWNIEDECADAHLYAYDLL